ncbi:MAG: four helix bundle protein [Deltaproteobacteria bacterium]|jgi:four helix bundle protein|nr:four helix bundle protein [Deltaproteobacteria bacterium]
MGTFKAFEEIEAWKKARELTRQIYDVSNLRPFSKDFGLRDQIRRAAVSIMSNIAEGFERGGTKEFSQFLSVAKGSCGEVRCQLYVARDQGYLQDEAFEHLFSLTTETSRMLAGLMNYLRKSKIKGTKYK